MARGQQLLNPETGWKRIEDSNSYIKYYGTFVYDTSNVQSSSSTLSYSGELGSKIEFVVYTDKIRIIQHTGTKFNSDDERISIDGVEHVLDSKNVSGNVEWGSQIVTYEELNMTKGLHHIIMYAGTGPNEKLNLDAIDIDANGYILNFDHHLIKTPDDKYYTIENNSLVEIAKSDITEDVFFTRGILTYNIANNLNLLPEQFRLVSNNVFNYNIKGIKATSQMVVQKSSVSTKLANTVDFIKGIYNKNSNSAIKVIFSNTDGATWKTYKDGSFANIDIEIPSKDYSELSPEELVKWNSAKNKILLEGIDLAILETLDFNSLNMDRIKFAYVLSITSKEDTCKISKVQMQYDEKPSFQKMKDTEVTIKTSSNNISINPLIDNELLKISIDTGSSFNNTEEDLTEDQAINFVNDIINE